MLVSHSMDAGRTAAATPSNAIGKYTNNPPGAPVLHRLRLFDPITSQSPTSSKLHGFSRCKVEGVAAAVRPAGLSGIPTAFLVQYQFVVLHTIRPSRQQLAFRLLLIVIKYLRLRFLFRLF
ncbi:hypothetical protein P5V15_014040 [Pogonomyrmex californicus]